MITQLSHIDERKINNTGWMRKWWWEEGWNERQTPILRECWTFLIYIFLHQQRKQCLKFALPKLRETCKYLAGACNSNSHARGLHYLKKNVSEKLRVIYPLWNEEKSLANWIRYICRQKTTTSLWNLDRKGNWIKRKSVTTSL